MSMTGKTTLKSPIGVARNYANSTIQAENFYPSTSDYLGKPYLGCIREIPGCGGLFP
jgi:hypothetical protein